MHYIKWTADKMSYEIWRGPSLGSAAMLAKGYERVDALPPVPVAAVPLENLVFSKYKVAQKLMALGLWENVKANLTEEQTDVLYLAQDFRLSDPIFAGVYAAFQTQITDIDALLRECVLD